MFVGRGPLPFTDALCVEYLTYLDTPQEKGGKGDCPNHCANSRYALKWWRAQLGDVNLRALTVDDIRWHVPVVDERDEAGALRKAPKSRKLKIQVVKAFASWLRKVRGDGLTQGEGPDMSFLTVPQYRGPLKVSVPIAQADLARLDPPRQFQCASSGSRTIAGRSPRTP